ncbi:MAG: insulinase family protein [Clostridia bacterium]|nr:insulinase family protein [Clostridia bacterium]
MEKFLLSNGLTVLVEEMPYLRSASIGVWVKAGSMLENERDNGLSHLMEHMAFKGTGKRTARQIAEEMDMIGGMMNASTSKLCTNYYCKVIDEDLPKAADILSDIVCHPLIAKDELDKERHVVLEEIAMVEDSPEDVVFDVLAEAAFGDQSLGMTILGPAEKIAAYTAEDLFAFRNKHYGPQNAVIAIAGNVKKEQAKKMLEDTFGSWQGAAGEAFPETIAVPEEKKLCRNKETEQMHLALSFRGLPMGDKQVYAMAVMNTILGGGMSSRLFQKIREERGLVYSVYSGPSNYPGCGEFSIYAATSPKHTKTVMQLIDEEIQLLLDKGITEKEFLQAKAHIKGGFILGLESAYSRMSSMGHNQILLGRYIPPEDTIRAIENVQMEDVMRIAGQILKGPKSMALVGNKAEKYL